ncbi:hypothetical protein RGU70_08490 [Herbaspirillum sp. RTI4]|uniref:hypothetical protein n=1 Tax=Herbaspirillum sp. RTI4 TaxID=3048640 RepID=UPI002AB47769|nr:hypothetical protein [Herbaspirillum sp. RTI4]MDY7578358.1 hypothetical protein [Herbaspirillum sp. RTI4]
MTTNIGKKNSEKAEIVLITLAYLPDREIKKFIGYLNKYIFLSPAQKRLMIEKFEKEIEIKNPDM